MRDCTSQDKLLETSVFGLGLLSYQKKQLKKKKKHLKCLDNAALVMEHWIGTKPELFPFCTSTPRDIHSEINCFRFLPRAGSFPFFLTVAQARVQLHT